MSELGLVPVQLLSFLWSIALGAVIGVVYDCFRIGRIAFKTPAVLVAVQDIFFGFLVCVISFFYLLTVTDGKLRIFLLLGEAVGWALYYATIGDVVMALSGMILRAVSAVLNFLWRLAVLILSFAKGVLLAVFRFFYGIFVKPIVFIAKLLLAWLGAVALNILSKLIGIWQRIIHRLKAHKLSSSSKRLKKGAKQRQNSKYFLQRKA